MGDSDPDIEALRLAREESRVVLDHQIRLQEELDDKALRTVRLSLLLIAIVVSIVQLAPPSDVDGFSIGVQVGYGFTVFLLFVAVVLGIILFSETSVPFGIGEVHRRDLIDGDYSEREWLEMLLEEYDDWTEGVKSGNDSNSTLLFASQASVLVAIVYMLSSTAGLLTPLTTKDALILITSTTFVALLGWLAVQKVRERR